MPELHGADPALKAGEGYETPDEYAGQGDTRVVRALRFLYTVGIEDPAGNTVVESREAFMGEEVSLDQIGLLAQKKGEEEHLFYTDDERERLEAGQNPDASAQAVSESGDISSLGEYELAGYIKENNLTVNQTVGLAEGDKDLAHRLLLAENIATDGEPRKGVEAGLTSIIESS
jgi:hypothetical protein